MFKFFKKQAISQDVTIIPPKSKEVEKIEEPKKQYKKQTLYTLIYELRCFENGNINTFSNTYNTINRDDYIKKINHINESIKENHNILTLNGGIFTCINIGIEFDDFIVVETNKIISIRYINSEDEQLIPVEENKEECNPQI